MVLCARCPQRGCHRRNVIGWQSMLDGIANFCRLMLLRSGGWSLLRKETMNSIIYILIYFLISCFLGIYYSVQSGTQVWKFDTVVFALFVAPLLMLIVLPFLVGIWLIMGLLYLIEWIEMKRKY